MYADVYLLAYEAVIGSNPLVAGRVCVRLAYDDYVEELYVLETLGELDAEQACSDPAFEPAIADLLDSAEDEFGATCTCALRCYWIAIRVSLAHHRHAGRRRGSDNERRRLL